MKVFSKEVFEEVKNPAEKDYLKIFLKMPKAQQLKWLNAYKEYDLEMKVYQKVIETGKTIEEVFLYDQEINEAKKSLALTRYALLRSTQNSDREYRSVFSRHSYAFNCVQTQDVRTRFDIYRQVKTFSIKPYLRKEAQTIPMFF